MTERTPDPTDVLWVKDYHTSMWHRSVDPDGSRVTCGKVVPGSPLVVRRADSWQPTAPNRCSHCLDMLEIENNRNQARRNDAVLAAREQYCVLGGPREPTPVPGPIRAQIHCGLGAVEGDEVLRNLPSIPRVASGWFRIPTSPNDPQLAEQWIRTAYCGTRVVRLAVGPRWTTDPRADLSTSTHARKKGWVATWASPDHPESGYTACCLEKTAPEAFRAACDALRADGWLLGGPDVPEPWTVPKT